PSLRSGQFPLTGIAAAGINQGFVLSLGYRALWCKFHVPSLRSGQFPLTGIAAAGINQGFVLSLGYRALWC
ncbi:hypothetical protein CKQ90_36155, partial [Klebsiella pneumoniae]